MKYKSFNILFSVSLCLQDYCLRIDPVSNLGLNTDAVQSYHIADQITRQKGSDLPELLPCGYLVGENTNVTISLKGEENSVIALLH